MSSAYGMADPPQEAGSSAGLDAAGRSIALARYYDLDVLDITDDVELYLELAREAGDTVLELGAGSGRLAIPLALAGHRVLGVDDDRAMLMRGRAAWARARGAIDPRRLRLVQADVRTFQTGSRFDLSFFAVNTFLLARDDAERLAVLATMHRHLRPGGLACLDVVTPGEQELAGYDGRLQLEWLREDLETGDQVSKTISARHDPDAGTVDLTQIFEATPPHGGPLSRVVRTDTLHLISATDLAALAQAAGFAHVDVWGDHRSTPYGAGSHRAILIARAL